jgi:hypothetical protein
MASRKAYRKALGKPLRKPSESLPKGLAESVAVTVALTVTEERSSPAAKASDDPPADQLELSTTASDPQAEKNEAVYRVFTSYPKKTARNPNTYDFTSDRKKKGLARLEECLKRTSGNLEKAIGLMMTAVDAIAASDWHMGRDAKTQGKRYRDWDDHLFGSYKHMERW